MKITCLILTSMFYSIECQFGVFGGGGGKSPLNNPLGSISSSVDQVQKSVGDLEKLFLQDWLDFGKKFNKNYNPIEAPLRKANFLQNIDTITKLAKDSAFGFSLKINEFADMLFEEFNSAFNGFNKNKQLTSHPAAPSTEVYKPTASSIPESVDWRQKGAVSPVKNQDQCAGCWAFAVAGCVEGQNAVRTGSLKEASIQHLIDCATGKYDNDGCRGGLTETGFDFVEDNGINSYADYPYEAVNTTCRAKKENTVAATHGYVRIPQGDEKALAEAVATKGPVSVAIHATKNFQFYGDNIFDDPECGNTPDHLNHAVLIVGYGKEANGRKYWLVKNSYGTTWGEEGYLKLAKDEGNKCGIATYARYPKL